MKVYQVVTILLQSAMTLVIIFIILMHCENIYGIYKIKSFCCLNNLVYSRYIFYGLDYFQHTAPSVLIKPISQGMGVGVEEIAYIMNIYFPIYAISQIPADILLDKFGSKIMLSISCLVMSFGILFFIYDPTLNTMFIGRLLIAIGSAVAFIGTLKVAADVLPQNLFPVAVGFTNSIGVLGRIFGQVYIHNLVEMYDWQSALGFIGYLGIF